MRWLRRGPPVPPVLRQSLDRAEEVRQLLSTADGGLLAVSRFGLWRVDGERAERWAWHLISRVRLAGGRLSVTVADEVDRWEDGTAVLRDRAPVVLQPEALTRLTDEVHHRVRASVSASEQIVDSAGAPVGWVVLRRVPGRDGLTVQVRVEPGMDAALPVLPPVVAQVADRLWPEAVPRRRGSAAGGDEAV